MPKKYPEEFKKQIVVFYRNGTPIQELCQKHRVAQSTLYRWMREYSTDAEGHTLTDYKTLQKEKTRIVHILQIIRLSGIISNTSRSKRLDILADLYAKFDHYGVSELCDALDIAKGTFYNHIFRRRIVRNIWKNSRNSGCKYSGFSTTASSGMVPRR